MTIEEARALDEISVGRRRPRGLRCRQGGGLEGNETWGSSKRSSRTGWQSDTARPTHVA